MKNKFEIDSACYILGLQLEHALNYLADHHMVVHEMDGKHYTDDVGIEELEKLAHAERA
ncbi:hypothetical protein [Paenibacillus sp. UNC451MF]|uniref:hypothetical protein n=1 Tax=Paenibacillus sp. UNC451MF TaxID=1449063 RepID=UPI000AE7CB0C|nr:hypothetical protein [Paenibacillus sp. UNC451MF]